MICSFWDSPKIEVWIHSWWNPDLLSGEILETLSPRDYLRPGFPPSGNLAGPIHGRVVFVCIKGLEPWQLIWNWISYSFWVPSLGACKMIGRRE